jgi:uncharacterized membrane protein required for colicin V production
LSTSADVLGQINLGWFDLVVAVLLVIGLFRGRKRGMSEELLDLFKWLLIVVVGAFLYRPLGDLLDDYVQVSPTTARILAYLTVAVTIKLLFTWIKHAVGEKLVGSDLFGRMEYYLGMASGVLRWACMILAGLAILNAKHISDADLKATAKMQKDNFGDISFPTFGSFQQDIFKNSFTGSTVKKHLADQLIAPTSTGGKTADRENIGQRRSREVDEVMNTKPKT